MTRIPTSHGLVRPAGAAVDRDASARHGLSIVDRRPIAARPGGGSSAARDTRPGLRGPRGPRGLAMAGLAAIVMALGVLIGPGADRAMAYPEPSVIPTSWELDVTYKRPRLIRLVDFAGEQSWYWFMVYEVTNNTGEDRLFVPDVAIADDAGRILNAGQQVPSAVYPAIKRRLGDPLLVSPVEVVGTLRQGEDNARRTVAIWPALPDVDVDQMSVFLSGLSGETVEIQNPLTAEPVLLRKTLMLDYTLPGAPLDFGDTQIRLRDATWIMR